MSKKSKFLKTKEESTNHLTESEVSKVLEFNIKEYGMSVIEDRMIPSIRDGLKPSQRRLLKAMYDLKAWNTAPTRSCQSDLQSSSGTGKLGKSR